MRLYYRGINNMKKALFVANTDSFHKNFHLPYIDRLKAKGYSVELVSTGDVIFDGIAIRHNIIFGRTPLKIKNLKAFWLLRKLLNTYYDIIYFSTPIVGAVGRVALIGKKRGRVIYSAHGYSFYKGNPSGNTKYIFIEKLLCRLTDCTFTMNKEDFSAVRNYKFPCKEIYNVDGVGIDLSVYNKTSISEKSALRKQYGFNDDDFILIYPAELTERKNQSLLIKTMNLLVQKYKNVKLLLLGRGVKGDEYKKLSHELGLEDYVLFMGYRNDVHQLLKLSDALFASSLNEGLPINIIEALASGLPVVATNTRGQNDLIEEGYNGYLFEVGDCETACDIICQFIENKELLERISNQAIESSKKYDLQIVVPQYDKIWGI